MADELNDCQTCQKRTVRSQGNFRLAKIGQNYTVSDCARRNA